MKTSEPLFTDACVIQGYTAARKIRRTPPDPFRPSPKPRTGVLIEVRTGTCQGSCRNNQRCADGASLAAPRVTGSRPVRHPRRRREGWPAHWTRRPSPAGGGRCGTSACKRNIRQRRATGAGCGESAASSGACCRWWPNVSPFRDSTADSQSGGNNELPEQRLQARTLGAGSVSLLCARLRCRAASAVLPQNGGISLILRTVPRHLARPCKRVSGSVSWGIVRGFMAEVVGIRLLKNLRSPVRSRLWPLMSTGLLPLARAGTAASHARPSSLSRHNRHLSN
jgi:hypothetical protein